jgi:predicted O-methyltransferase YrrM
LAHFFASFAIPILRQVGPADAAIVKLDYPNYYERCLRLLSTGGPLMFDNTLWGGSVADPDDQEEDTLALR